METDRERELKKNWITCVPLKETGPDQCLTFEGFSVGPPDGGCCARWTRPQIMIFGNKKWQNGSFSTVYPCFDRGMGIHIARWGRMVSLSAPGAKESDIWTPQNFVVWHSWWVSNRLAPRDFNSNLPRNFDRNWFFVIRYSVEPSQFFKFWFFLQTIFLFFFF